MKNFYLLSRIDAVNSALSANLIYAIKGIIIIITILLVINFIDGHKKKKKTKKYITLILFLLVFGVSLYLFVFTRLVSREEQALYLKRQKLTFARGEQIIDALEAYKKVKEYYPLTLSLLKNYRQGVNIKDGFGRDFMYFSDKHTFRISFKLPCMGGYYFYNSINTSRSKIRGYYFKYMDENPLD